MVLSANEEQMNTKIANNLYSKKTPLQSPNGKKVELRGSKRQAAEKPMPNRRRSSRERKLVLLQDVENLKKKLRHEENVHRALQRAFNRPLGALPRLPPYLPQDTLELLAEVAVLEEEVVRLEEQVVNFRQGLYQEASYTSSRDELDLELSMRGGSKPRHSRASSQSEVDSPCVSRTPSAQKLVYDGARKQQGCVLENGLVRESRLENDTKSCSDKKPKLIGLTPVKKPPLKPSNSPKMQCRIVEQAQESSCSSSDDKTVEIESEANKMSQDILNCLISIFVRMSSSRRKTMDFSSLGSKAFSQKETSFRDPYFNSTELKKREIGNYKHLYLIEAHSVDLNRRSTASFLIRRLRILLNKLASMKVDGLSHHQKLAFWINIYNACIMNAFLEHGIPQSPEMMVVQMQKATIKVGGHALNAVTIEHLILRLPYHLKYTCTKSSKNDEKAICRTLGLEWSEALVTFALSNGSWSSPALRVYTAVDIESELEAAKKAYLQAAVGISSSNKLVVPKLLQWYLLDFAKDMEALLDWICLELPDEGRNEAVKCLESRDKEPLAKLVQVMPYNFSFRYLVYR